MPVDEGEVPDNAVLLRQLELLEEEEERNRRDRENSALIQREIQKLLPGREGAESTLDAFKRLTEDAAWIPFRLPSSSTAMTDVDQEEARLFEEMKVRYKRKNGRPSNNYHAFARDWNNEAARRLTLWSQGDESIVQSRLKSTILLNEYHDALLEYKALQALVPNGGDAQREQLNNQLRVSRQSLPPTRVAQVVTPTQQYVNNGGYTPFGVPANLNPQIAFGAVAGIQPITTTNNAPLIIRGPTLPQTAPARPTRQFFRSRRYCIVCGYLRSLHGEDEDPGINCKRTHCGNCKERKDCHGANDGWGRLCKRRLEKDKAEWYETKVRLLLIGCTV